MQLARPDHDRPVWLLGTEPQLRAAARAAVRASASAGGLPDDVATRLVVLHGRRARLWSLSPTLAAGESSPDGSGGDGSGAPGRWWWLVGATAVGPALAAVVLLVAPTPSPAAALTAALAILVLATGAAVDLVRDPAVPDPRGVRRATAENAAAALVVGAVLGLVLALTVVLAPDRSVPAWWTLLLAVPIVLAGVVAARLERARRRRPTAEERREMRADTAAWLARETLREARALARLPRDADLRREATRIWHDELGALARYLPEDVLGQAREMSPAAWLTWWAYDGRTELRPELLVPLRQR